MRSTSKISLAIATIGVAAVTLVGCSGSAPAASVPEPKETVAVAAPEDTAATESTFKDMTLTTPESIIKITDVKTIAVGEPGNEYGDAPVIAFWYETTNLTDADVSPMTWIFTFNAFQDNDPNAVNELNVGALPDPAFLDSQSEKIKKGGTVANAVAYELTDTTTPVTLVASEGFGSYEIGSMTFELK